MCVSVYRAMENTLLLMNSKNENYRKSLSKVDTSSKLCVHALPVLMDVIRLIVCFA